MVQAVEAVEAAPEQHSVSAAAIRSKLGVDLPAPPLGSTVQHRTKAAQMICGMCRMQCWWTTTPQRPSRPGAQPCRVLCRDDRSSDSNEVFSPPSAIPATAQLQSGAQLVRGGHAWQKPVCGAGTGTRSHAQPHVAGHQQPVQPPPAPCARMHCAAPHRHQAQGNTTLGAAGSGWCRCPSARARSALARRLWCGWRLRRRRAASRPR